MTSVACPLCSASGGTVVWQHERFRVVRAEEVGFPAFYRVIWNAHVAEWSDLDESDQALCLRAVTAVERVLRQYVQPTKVNLASLGNVVPHLHWHVIARFDWDSHYPTPVWGPPVREPNAAALQALQERVRACDAALAQGLW